MVLGRNSYFNLDNYRVICSENPVGLNKGTGALPPDHDFAMFGLVTFTCPQGPKYLYMAGGTQIIVMQRARAQYIRVFPGAQTPKLLGYDVPHNRQSIIVEIF